LKLYHGDCLEVMKDIPDCSVDMILQDPPYNTTDCSFEWDIMTKIDELWGEWKRIIKDIGVIVMTASQPFTTKLIASNYDMFKYEWVWVKNTSTGFQHAKNMPLKKHENVLVFSKGSIGHSSLLKEKRMIYNPQGITLINKTSKNTKNKWGNIAGNRPSHKETFLTEYSNYPVSTLIFDSEKGYHPTQKPTKLMEYLINTYSNENEIVFDGFMGSGTTGVACINTNRNFIGIEKDDNYFKIAKERIEKANTKLF